MEDEEEFEFQSFLNGDCITKLCITTDEYQIGREGGFYYDPNPPANDTVKRTKSNNHSSISSSDLEESSIANESNSAAVASASSGGFKLIHPSPKATFSEFEPIHQLLETADIIVDDNNNNIKGSGCSEDDEEGKAAVDDTAATAQGRPKISFQIVNPKLKKNNNNIKSMANKANNVTHQQEQKSKLIEEEESFDFTTINDKDFITSWITMQK
jgi:hypothetical protein